MNAKQKFDSLTEKSVWSYTKQAANFKDLFLSAKLFNDIPDISNTNVENYFTLNYSKYGISTNRHRILAIAQMFGVITKTSYYSRGGSSYSQEFTTPVFQKINGFNCDSDDFKKIMSEQLIKIKVKAIIDTKNYRDDYYIYPFLFLFLVMWKLDTDYGIKSVSYDKVWTYILTCKSMDEIDSAVEWMMDPNAQISPLVQGYKSDSRIMTLIFDNTMMFSLENGLLSLNHPIAENFYNEFVCKQDLAIIQSFLFDDVKYKNYLENFQDFNFDLTSNPTGYIKHKHYKKSIFTSSANFKASSGEISVVVPEKESSEINDILDAIIDLEEEKAIKEASVYDNENEINESNNRVPELRDGLEKNKRYSTDPRLAKTAIKKAGFVCELSGKIFGNHATFDSVHGTKYLEAHHLIPMKAQKDFVSLGINLDRMENIVALCPVCHKAVHYGTKEEKKKYLEPLYNARKDKLKGCGIDIDFDALIDIYY